MRHRSLNEICPWPARAWNAVAGLSRGDMARKLYEYKMKKNPSRLNILSEELDNIPMVALRQKPSSEFHVY